jgi:uncharacterized linocin/CFP29 family protein
MSAGDRYHEPIDLLSDDSRELHRALPTLVEELGAVDRYKQRADACGNEALGIVGIGPASSHDPIRLGGQPERYPGAVVDAVERLRNADINGPYGLVLCHRTYGEVSCACEEGYPILRRLASIAALVLRRGKDPAPA